MNLLPFKFWILLFGLQSAHGIPINEFITENSNIEMSSPITPIMMLNTMGNVLEKLLSNNFSTVPTLVEGEPETKISTDIANPETPTESTISVPSKNILNSAAVETTLEPSKETKISDETSQMNTERIPSENTVTVTQPESTKLNETLVDTENNVDKIQKEVDTPPTGTTENELPSSTRETTTETENYSTSNVSMPHDKITENSNSPSIEITSTETSAPSGDSTSAAILNEDKTQSIEVTDKLDNLSMAAMSHVNNSEAPTTDNIAESDKNPKVPMVAINPNNYNEFTVVNTEALDGIGSTTVPEEPVEGSGGGNFDTNTLDQVATNKLEIESLTGNSVTNLSAASNSSFDQTMPGRNESITINSTEPVNTTTASIITETQTPTTKITATTMTPSTTTTFRPRPTSIPINPSTSINPSTTTTTSTPSSTTTKINPRTTPKENGAPTPQTASLILISISFFYLHILM